MSARLDLSGATIDDLVAVYVEAAAAHLRASEAGDHERANTEHDRVADVYRELRTRGPEAHATLLALLDHPDPGVRTWAGAHSLEFAPEEAVRALEQLSAEGGLAGFNAEVTLDMWRAGGLRFP